MQNDSTGDERIGRRMASSSGMPRFSTVGRMSGPPMSVPKKKSAAERMSWNAPRRKKAEVAQLGERLRPLTKRKRIQALLDVRLRVAELQPVRADGAPDRQEAEDGRDAREPRERHDKGRGGEEDQHVGAERVELSVS